MFRTTPTRQQARRPSVASPAVWLQLAVAYLIVSVVLGMVMGASHDFSLRSVHVHLSLMGWTTLAIAGLVYAAYPALGASRLARVHFWTYNLALPPMMVALGAMLLGRAEAVPVLAVTQLVATVGMLAFALNVFINLSRAAARRPWASTARHSDGTPRSDLA